MKDLFRFVLMESGDMCVKKFLLCGFGKGLLIITQEWCVANLGILHHVSYITIKDFYFYSNTSTCNYPLTVYSPSTSLFRGGSQQPTIYGRVSCSGNEQTLSSCSKYVNYDSWYCQHYKLGVVCEGE